MESGVLWVLRTEKMASVLTYQGFELLSQGICHPFRVIVMEYSSMWHYVYILRNQKGEQYVGKTADLRKRLEEHNKGSVRSTKKKRPWSVQWFCGFPTEEQAVCFEKHLKTGSGTAFRFRHFVAK